MIQVRLHGTPQLTFDDGSTVALAPREAALLAWLHLEGDTPRASIAGRWWPSGSESQARANLRQMLRRLRQGAPQPLVDEGGSGLRLAASVRVIDVGVGCVGGIGGVVGVGVAARLLGALEFDDAPELAGWLAARRDADQRERLRLRMAAAAAALDAGDLDTALAVADAVLAEQPEVEQAHRVRMQVFHLRGDRAAAIGAWDDCRHALRLAFGIAPSAATAELGRQLLAQETTPGAAIVAGPALPAVLRRPPSLVGRDTLMRSLALALAAGDSIVITGAGGIGKTRLLQSLLAAAGESALLTGARIGDAVDPGAVIRRLADAASRRDAPASAAADDPVSSPLRSPADQRMAADALAAMFARCVAGGLRWLAVEDLHLADGASLDALGSLAGRWLDAADDSPQLLLTARRDELSDAGQALLQSLSRSSRVRVVELAPLDPAGLKALLRQPALAEALGQRLARGVDVDALASALRAAVGGNPAFVLEALRQLWLGGDGGWSPGAPIVVPPTLVDAPRARFDRLPALAMQVAQLAAVAGGDFDAGLAADALGVPLIELAPTFAALESAQVFQRDGFGDDLVAQAVRSSLAQALLGPLHREVAAHLVRRGASAARIAHHLQAGGAAAQAAPWLLRAAEDARSRWQQADAASLFARAAEAMDPVGERAAVLRAWCDAVRACLWIDRHDAAADGLRAARALVRGDDEQVMVVAREIALSVARRDLGGVGERASLLCERLRASADRLPPAELAYALRVACRSIQHGGPRDEVLALCESARERVRGAAPEDAALWATAYGATLHWLGRPVAAIVVLEQAEQQLGDGGDPGARFSLLDQTMRVRHSLGDVDGALAAARRLRPLARLADARLIAGCDVLHVGANLLAASGRAARGMACHAVLRERLRRAGEPPREAFEVSHVFVCIAAGRHDLAQATLDALPTPPGGGGSPIYDHARGWAAARLRQARGLPVADLLAMLEGLPMPAAGPALHRRVMHATLRRPPLADALALVDETHGHGYLALERVACGIAAAAAVDAGEPATAIVLTGRALALARHVDAWGDEPASVWAGAVSVYDAVGQSRRADAVAARAAAWVQARAAQWPAGEARRAWLDGNPLHRRLLARAAATPR